MPVEGTRNLSTCTPVHRLRAGAEVRRYDGAQAGRPSASKVTGERRPTLEHQA
ncbi:hypothetical protein [Streptomyces mexicanus]|jgi:hypothetical protein|uniref:Uncharacterized protein n=1 Tax=Streptomyces mexicanus TaxID=178566 RepID=A0A7X1I495_9ACTN|nr:hypothetical protein [Streptomyces mexicanus]MBC2866248.1 hypothetical protein [Streptomyces mexicanus]